MRGDAGTSGDDLESLLQAIQDRAETDGADQAELVRDWRRRVTDQQNASEESWAKIIQAVAELLSSVPLPAERRSLQDSLSVNWEQAQSLAAAISESGNQRARPVLWDLTDGPNGLAQLQSLSMLAGIVRAFSQVSGRPEAEILEELRVSQRRQAG
jgi:hypothetical protein